jgi:hypothetical protein
VFKVGLLNSQLVFLMCSSFPCDHPICDECLPKLPLGDEDTVRCPMCKQTSPRGEVEPIQRTERQRWDELLKIAAAWESMDRRGEFETSDEEGEERFINDDRDTT